MGRLAVVGKQRTIGPPTSDAPVAFPDRLSVFDLDTHVSLYRHGVDVYVAPHRIDHAAHMQTLAGLGCDRVLALSSVGSLRRDLPVGSFVAPDDFLALEQPPIAVYDDERQHVVPGFTPAWRERVIGAWRDAGGEAIVDGGVYWQTNGPRFETPAEIQFIATVADIVGMTVPSECVAANQVGLAYAAVCVVDNLANGVDDTPLTTDAYERNATAQAGRSIRAVERVINALASP